MHENIFGKQKCKKCGIELKGLTSMYTKDWICSECAEDRQSVLYCETGCKVIAKHLDHGYDSDKELAKKYLEQDKIYTIDTVSVGGWKTDVTLIEVPNHRFNSVHFERIE